MKYRFIAVIICLVLLLLSACKEDEQQQSGVSTLSTAHFDMYTYLREDAVITADLIDAHINALTVHDDRIYICYQGYDAGGQNKIAIMSIFADGNVQQHAQIPFKDIIQVRDFRILSDGNFAMVAEQWVFLDDNIAINYMEYDYEGNELFHKNFNGLPLSRNRHWVRQAVITENGNIVLSVAHEQDNYIYLLHKNNDDVTSLKMNAGSLNESMIARLTDERVFVTDVESGEIVLREIDFAGRGWGEIYPVTGNQLYKLFPAGDDTAYDLLMSDRIDLYGFNLETRKQEILLKWSETGIYDLAGSMYTGSFNSGNLFVINRNRGMHEEAYILSPVLRSETPVTEKTTLILGGLHITDEIRMAAAQFNKTNPDYFIEVDEYAGPGGDMDAGLARLQIELMTGRGPDILYDWSRNFPAPALYMDLYPFIDADKEINRSDFFPNVLNAMESPDGCLYRLSTDFDIDTVIGNKETIGYIENWTPAELIKLIEDSAHLSHPFGSRVTGGRILYDILSFFIDWDNYAVDFNDDSVTDILNVTKLLPVEPDMTRFFESPFLYILRNEQVLNYVWFRNFSDFQGYSEVLGDNFYIIGNPTPKGGVSYIRMTDSLGINSATEHADGAWEFLRGYLLPEVLSDEESIDRLEHSFPLRIDAFETLLDFAQSPPVLVLKENGDIFLDDNGEPVPVPRNLFRMTERIGDDLIGSVHELYSMTDETAALLRWMIESAQSPGRRISRELNDIIESDLDAFYAGSTTAEHTARVLQNRIQIYLSEQQLLNR